MKTLQVIALIAVLSGGDGRADPPRVPAGFLEDIEGPVSLCPFPCPGTFKELTKASAAGKILYGGDIIRCGKNAKARVYKSASEKDVPNICGNGDVVVDPPQYTPQRPIAGQTLPTLAMLESYGRRAGRDKGTESPIYSPPANGAVLASEFTVRWRTNPPLPKLTVILRDRDNSELARVDSVDGALGVLESDLFRKALITYRDSVGPNLQVQITFKDESGREQSVPFSLLTPSQERMLNQELSHLNPSHGLFGYVERAAVFESFHMYASVAAEYDSALKEAPQSHDMLEAAFQANSRIGNLRRARDLRDTLQKIDEEDK